MRTSCFIKKLPIELLKFIINYLDDFQKLQLSLTCKKYYRLFYNHSLSSDCNFYFLDKKRKMNTIFNIIRRIGSEGVYYGQCEDCLSHELLYTAFRPKIDDERFTKSICLENCKFQCFFCQNMIKCHVVNDIYFPILCDHCRSEIFLFI